ncbi:hypothetical protein RU87_GL000408 [Lactococcus plantarum]|uniref:DUF4352 domain-containing protein n=2 Tax=Pseudolactococcus plantarum TaxID=1365 RepID=A0A2A5RX02_9LACT|nr:hypothetical protein RU87_GL000408 [Lactococcus plantarum]HCN74443.1 DUF4352 domain-containing protein [Lactococcus sp.]
MMSLNDGIETNQDKKKNPILKFWWVWSIIILVAIGILVPNLIIQKAMSTNSVTQTGKNKIVKVGDSVTQNGVHYQINSVKYNTGTKYSKPDDGNQYVIVNITIENKGKDTVSYNRYNFKLDDAGNQTSFSDYLTGDDGKKVVNDILGSGDLAEGGKVTGSMIGQAKIGEKYKLVYSGYTKNYKKSTITFNLN